MTYQNQFLIFQKSSEDSLLDHLTVEIERRFDHASIPVYSGLVIIRSKMVSSVYKNVNWKKNLVYLLIFSKMIFHVPRCWRQNWTYGKHIG